MLLIQSNGLALSLTSGERLRFLDALAARGQSAPLIRSARQRFFQMLAAQGSDGAFDAAAASKLERECAARLESKGDAAYVPGELFCMGDCVLTLVFGESADEGLSASVVYSVETAEPLAKLERFCRDVREALAEMREDVEGETQGEQGKMEGEPSPESPKQPPADLPLWQTRRGSSPNGLARFMALQPVEFVRAAAALRGGRELTRASELLEEQAVRHFLRRVQEMRREGYTPRRLFSEAGTLGTISVERMLDAGLLEREVRVSCRKSGHALFDLPTPDSLAAITISKAKCSQCAAPVADEVIEETINPSRLAVSLLEDGRWLTNRIYKIIRTLGIPDSEIASGPASSHGESYLAVDVCGNSFLFVTRDGDLTPAFSRRVAEIVEETEATQLVVVITGAAEDEGRLRLYEFAWRRARDGHDLGTTLVEGLSGARAQIERSFEMAVRRELSHKLFTLDAALGFSAGNFVLDWFKLAKASGAEGREADTRTQFAVSSGR
ncbi:MAG: hypothetical protein QOH51_530 [Acidobacteriota bacterium]|jgi:hypothetical protein|nr:hypothetical protein [Acidobacteriota bacterium]